MAKYTSVTDQFLHRFDGDGHHGAALKLVGGVLRGSTDAETAKAGLKDVLLTATQGQLGTLEPTGLKDALLAAAQGKLTTLESTLGSLLVAQNSSNSSDADALSGAAVSEMVATVMGGVQDIMASLAGPNAVTALQLQETLSSRTSQLEAAIRAEVTLRVDQHVAKLPLDQIHEPVIDALRSENSRLAAENARLTSRLAELNAAESEARPKAPA